MAVMLRSPVGIRYICPGSGGMMSLFCSVTWRGGGSVTGSCVVVFDVIYKCMYALDDITL